MVKKNHITEQKEECCGCGACVEICPVKAISFKYDELGFGYPQVEEDICISCGLCTEVCQIGRKFYQEESRQTYYSAQNKDERILKESSSGGIFDALGRIILAQGGSVCGAYFDQKEDWKVKHGFTDTIEGLVSLHGSKYIQSDTSEIYADVAKQLSLGKSVLYSGTPCQCQGMLQYLQRKKLNTDKLYLVDFVCHGVGSPKIWKEYISYLQKKNGSIQYVTFRDKENGWEHSKTKILNSENKNVSENELSFFKMYRSLLIMRRSCFKCSFTDYNRCSDITLGDFWNIGVKGSAFKRDMGVSQILINTSKGERLFKQIENDVLLVQCSKKECWQPHLEYPIEYPKGREDFLEYYKKYKFELVLMKYGKGTLIGKIKQLMVPLVRKMGLYVLAGKVYKIIGRRKEQC